MNFFDIMLAKKLGGDGGGGSGEISTQSLSVTANGTYRAPAGKAYTPVVVKVPIPTLETLTATDNGSYTPAPGSAYSSVVVAIPSAESEVF